MGVGHQVFHLQDLLANELGVLRLDQRQIQPDFQAWDIDFRQQFQRVLVVHRDLWVRLECQGDALILRLQRYLSNTASNLMPSFEPVLPARDSPRTGLEAG